ncbi:beta-lactamase domain protein [Haladaptatus paucihalophilus DX253]|uniref:Beta-lactamase domain protein n=1 Tax=Haladaptatus paucihalophilus DX253 TaxID=797209 RepID=E7QSX9_HALPU|nr:MBL fold metallo-hydrolase [Haladaptatus paucihalophilus]EFW92368.1 beta-lactamase domain protein [Haladaptatus paucihalophilus DX253]SHL61765.1 Glyoxylase, beta-lactamase superfamily II [Haladaptatus paucihalophilus DX253]
MSKTDFASTEISPEEVAERRDDDELFILDVRNEDDYEEWAVSGSYNLPIYDELLDEEFSGLESALDEIPKDKEIAVICVGGITSARAAEFLQKRGYEARSMSDGMRGWGRVHQTYEVDGERSVLQIVRPGTGCVSYLVYDGDEALVVDPSQYVTRYRDIADDLGVDIVGAIDSHAHADHISGGREIADKFDVPYYLHEDDAGSLDEYTPIEDDETLSVGARDLEVIHTPGHTPGSVSFDFGGAVLSGDTLFLQSVGRPDLEDSNEDAIREAASDLFDSLQRLGEMPDDTVVLPGHFSDEEVRPLATTLYSLTANNELFGMVEDNDEKEFVETIVDALSDTPNNYQQIKHINWGDEPLDDDAEDLELGPNNCAAN